MTMLIGQMLACLLVAAAIGSAVGWFLRNISAGPLTQQLMEVTGTLRHRDQALEKLRYELKVKISAMQILESKMVVAEALHQSTRQELAASHERIHALQQELTATIQQLSTLESGQAALLTRNDTTMRAQAEEVRQSAAALEAAQQALALKEEELLPLQERLAALEHAPADTDHLRARIRELEPAQGRVHWLEVQLSEQDTQHRTALHDVERQLAERDRHIGELERAQQQLQEQADLAKTVGEHGKETDRLRKRLIEVQAALRIRTDGGVTPHSVTPAGDQLSLQINQTKPLTAQQKDDLKQIRGIGPAFERVLNNMGIVTFRQVAQWDATTMRQIADKLDTAPDRIKRDNWIASAKKLHEQKYGKRL
jgi:DNA repair exonuclease SbcCD ATPase subunit